MVFNPLSANVVHVRHDTDALVADVVSIGEIIKNSIIFLKEEKICHKIVYTL